MMKNRHLAKAIQEQCFYEFYRQIQYKCDWNNIQFIVADRYFPSSKTCYKCGNIKKDLKLSDRIYICSECGNEIDRDYQASLNLAEYGKKINSIAKTSIIDMYRALNGNLRLWSVMPNVSSIEIYESRHAE